jgi:hypothetical protein
MTKLLVICDHGSFTPGPRCHQFTKQSIFFPKDSQTEFCKAIFDGKSKEVVVFSMYHYSGQKVVVLVSMMLLLHISNVLSAFHITLCWWYITNQFMFLYQ